MTGKPIIFVCLEPPIKKIEWGRPFLFFVLKVPVEQLRMTEPTFYQRLTEKNVNVATIMIVHASSSGVMTGTSHDAIAKYQPDLIYCCYTNEARKLYAHYPISGNYRRTVWVHSSPKSRIVKLQEED